MGKGLFDRVQGEPEAREKSSGLQMSDLLALPNAASTKNVLWQPTLEQCCRCGRSVDDFCWNAQRGRCLDGAPDLESEASHVQTEAAINGMRA